MTRNILTIILSLLSCLAYGQAKWNSVYQSYIDTYYSLAVEQMQLHGIPASITLAQGLLESSAGNSMLATKANNHFGIKCNGWTGRSVTKDDDKKNECFRAYDSPRDSYEDHSLFLQRDRYKSLFSYSRTDYKSWAHGLKACGYATNPQYAYKLIELIELYNLQKYDTGEYMASTTTGNISQAPLATVTTPYQQPVVQPQASTKLPAVSANDHRVFFNNKNFYVIARKGDTFRSIATEFKTSYRSIARYNERDKNDRLSEGDIIYLKTKRGKADKAYKNKPHTLVAGQSLYDVAQIYGITLKALYKKNKLASDARPHIGMRLNVY